MTLDIAPDSESLLAEVAWHCGSWCADDYHAGNSQTHLLWVVQADHGQKVGDQEPAAARDPYWFLPHHDKQLPVCVVVSGQVEEQFASSNPIKSKINNLKVEYCSRGSKVASCRWTTTCWSKTRSRTRETRATTPLHPSSKNQSSCGSSMVPTHPTASNGRKLCPG